MGGGLAAVVSFSMVVHFYDCIPQGILKDVISCVKGVTFRILRMRGDHDIADGVALEASRHG